MEETKTAREVDQANVGVTVIIGWNHWGKGKTLAEAKANWKRLSRRNLSDGYTILEFDEVTEFLGVDQMGYVSWHATDGSPSNEHAPKDTDVPPKGR